MSGNASILVKPILNLLVILLANNSFATSVLTPEKPGGELAPLEESIPKSKAFKPDYILPEILPPAEESRLSEQLKVFVNHIELIGNTVFSDQELQQITSSYENREISTDELQEIRRKLTQYYEENGYITSEVIIPDQEVNSGSIVLQIIEGRLAEVNITGTTHLKESYVANRIQSNDDKPLNINQLQEKILLLHQDRLIEKINANLNPGDSRGKYNLDVAVEENRPYDFGFSFNNRRSPSVGELRGELWGTHHNLTGYGDALHLQYGLTEGLKDYAVEYSLPISAHDTRLGFSFSNSDSDIIEEPFNQFDIRSETTRWSLSISHPIIRKPNRYLSGTISLDSAKSKSFFRGGPLSFSPGSVDGVTRSKVIRLGLEWLDREENSVLFISSQVNAGILTDRQIVLPAGFPDGKFINWLTRLQWARRINFLDGQFIFRSDLQLSNQRLLNLDKIGIGGATTVRGYRENHLVRDNGLISSLEFRFPLTQFTIPWIDKSSIENRLQLAIFGDLGIGEDIRPGDQPNVRNFIHSAGMGIRWDADRYVHSQLYWAKAFNKPDQENGSLQDDGIHFSVDLFF